MGKASKLNKAHFGSRLEDEEPMYLHQKNKVEKFAEIIRSIPNKALAADLGCYTGLFSRNYLEAGIWKIEGFDIVDDALRVAEKRGINTFHWDMDGAKAPVEDKRYDVVIAGDVIEHLADTDNFIREVRRILKDDGRLILSTPNSQYWISRIMFLFGKMPWAAAGVSPTIKRDKRIEQSHLRFGSYWEWRNFLEKSGFAVERVETASYMPGGGIGMKLLSLFDRLLVVRRSLAYSLIFILRKGGTKSGKEEGKGG